MTLGMLLSPLPTLGVFLSTTFKAVVRHHKVQHTVWGKDIIVYQLPTSKEQYKEGPSPSVL